MFFEETRIRTVREMILAEDEQARRAALSKLLPMQRADFVELFEIMAGLPDRSSLRGGDLDGVLDNHRWRLEAKPAPGGAGPASATRWAPQTLALRVTGPYGDRMDIDMVRLQRVAGP